MHILYHNSNSHYIFLLHSFLLFLEPHSQIDISHKNNTNQILKRNNKITNNDTLPIFYIQLHLNNKDTIIKQIKK